MRQLPYASDTFTTLSGRQLKIIAPSPADIVLRDVAVALSRVCRFGGHVRSHLSVAQHSVLRVDAPRKLGRDL